MDTRVDLMSDEESVPLGMWLGPDQKVDEMKDGISQSYIGYPNIADNFLIQLFGLCSNSI